MPKDPTRNVDRYKIRGGSLNEFEYNQNQGAMSEEERERFERRQSEGVDEPPQSEAERIEEVMAEARRKAADNLSRKGTKKAAKKRPARKSAVASKKKGKSAAKPAARKAGAKKAVAAKKRTASGAKKGSAKKGSAKKAAGKRAASNSRKGAARRR